jgi:hypothetical protein
LTLAGSAKEAHRLQEITKTFVDFGAISSKGESSGHDKALNHEWVATPGNLFFRSDENVTGSYLVAVKRSAKLVAKTGRRASHPTQSNWSCGFMGRILAQVISSSDTKTRLEERHSVRGPASHMAHESWVKSRHLLTLLASSPSFSQAYYWSAAWQEAEKESREEYRRGEGVSFDSPADAIKWLLED